jgi:hypothetical protein
VTSPKGNVITLKPAAGFSTLQLVKPGTTTPLGTTFVRIRSVYADTANSGDPSLAGENLFFASAQASAPTEAEIATYAAQSSWKFDYFLAANTTTTPDATQYFKTRARAMTIAELRTQPLANLTDADIAFVKANSATTNVFGGNKLPTPATGPVTLDWVVPTGALAPTSLQVWGGPTASGTTLSSFSDNASVASTARTGDISCSAASAADKHCSSTGNFATGTGLNGAHLWASDASGRDFAHFYPFYTVTMP